MREQMVFKRYELKYQLSMTQYFALKRWMQPYMQLDAYGKHTIQNIYFDTPDYLLIRRSIEKPCYKEKLRVRSYGTSETPETVYIELKKKYRGVVYKRRLCLPRQEAFDFLIKGKPLAEESQIAKEIAYFLRMYPDIAPMVQLGYEREAYYGLDNPEFRMTFDQNVRVRFCQSEKEHTYPVIGSDTVLLEIKTADSIPLWLVSFLSAQQLYKTSFSKYGTAYQNLMLQQWEKERTYAS